MSERQEATRDHKENRVEKRPQKKERGIDQ
jgi:hypothetical protein